MIRYTVKFEYREPGAPIFKQHVGDFDGGDPRLLRDDITLRLRNLGYEVGAMAVYQGEWLAIGTVLSRPISKTIH